MAKVPSTAFFIFLLLYPSSLEIRDAPQSLSAPIVPPGNQLLGVSGVINATLAISGLLPF